MSRKDKVEYLNMRDTVKIPDHINKMFYNCKTKFRHQVSKVIISGLHNDNMAKHILEWVSQTKPEVVQKENKCKGDKDE